MTGNDTIYEVGQRVRYYGTTLYGQVTRVDEWDADADDEGRTIGIPPRVRVVFDDGIDERFVCQEYDRGVGWRDGDPPVCSAEELCTDEDPIEAFFHVWTEVAK